VGSSNPALLHCKYTTCRAGYIGLKSGVKSRDRLREKVDRKLEKRTNKNKPIKEMVINNEIKQKRKRRVSLSPPSNCTDYQSPLQQTICNKPTG
jgi:hypothetical protein